MKFLGILKYDDRHSASGLISCSTGHLGLDLKSSVCAFLLIRVTSCGTRELSPALSRVFTNTTIQPKPRCGPDESPCHLNDPVGSVLREPMGCACMNTLLKVTRYSKYILTDGSHVTWTKTAAGSG